MFEDNDRLRDSLSSLLSRSGEFALLNAFSDCREAEKHVISFQPEVILMDIDMPERNGIEAVKQIRTFDKKVQIIMLTIFDDNAHVFEALKAGANGYLLKKNIPEKLTVSIKEVLEGGAPMSPSIARMIITSIQDNHDSKNDYDLSKREKEILQSLSRGNSFKMIAAELMISVETVRTHIKNIYEKLHVHSQTEAVSKAINEKLV
ncbi:MAG: response regulator transcription factor [Chitinophagaceae bacterium]|nr:response regulator transcription factor [Chitinophagaceae bacterium]